MQATAEQREQVGGRSFVPSEEWIDAFEAQATSKDFEVKLHRFARMRANMVTRSGKRIDELYPRELVQDALADTLEGVIAWDPVTVTLEKHVFDAIRSRTRHDYVQAQRAPHLSFDASASAALQADVEAGLAAERGATTNDDAPTASTRVLSELRRLAERDRDVLLVLEAYEQDATKKVDVMRVAKLTAKKYDAARKRLHRLVLQLPVEIREALRA